MKEKKEKNYSKSSKEKKRKHYWHKLTKKNNISRPVIFKTSNLKQKKNQFAHKGGKFILLKPIPSH